MSTGEQYLYKYHAVINIHKSQFDHGYAAHICKYYSFVLWLCNSTTDNKMVGKTKIQTTQKLKIGQHDPQ